MVNCACGSRWRLEACDLRSGIVRAILHPISFEFETVLNSHSTGTLTLVTREVEVRDIWPHLTSVYITRLEGGDASVDNPVVEFAGMVETFEANDNGTTRVALRSIDYYLWHRVLNTRRAFEQISQNAIASALVVQASINGIPLFAEAQPSAFVRDRTYESWDKKNIGEAIQQLTEVINGPDWEFEHEKTEGAWASTMVFYDELGGNRNVILRSDQEVSGYGLTVDASEHATFVVAIGEGEEEAQLNTIAVDEANIYPQFDATPAFPTVSRLNTLQDHASGYLEDHKEPFTTPEITVAGLDPDPRMIRLGDTLNIQVNYGAVTYKGDARVLVISWGIDVDAPDIRTFTLLPSERASVSVLHQEPTDICEDC